MNVELSATKEVELYHIGAQMSDAGLPPEFVRDAVRTATEYKGVYHMMVYWRDAAEAEERKQTIADIKDMIDDCRQRSRKGEAYVKHKHLGDIAANIMRFKDGLRQKVDGQGGVVELAKRTGIPQPSLSRFFNSASRPRRTTLVKIAKALGLDESQIVTEWSK
jgi:DNA-binding phage protein